MIARMEPDIEELAVVFAFTRSARVREVICQLTMPFVRRLASRVLRRLPPHFTDDDLIGDGCVGLLRAIDRYDPRRGVSFLKWATRIIRGSMLNGLRRMDSVPERVRKDARTLDRARWNLAQDDATIPSDAVAAARAGLTTTKLAAVQLALRRAVPISLEAPIPQRYGNIVTLRDRLSTTDDDDPAMVASRRFARDALGRAVRRLPARERAIIAAFYGRQTSFRALGGHLGISKQRVSQIHNQALSDLRSALSPPAAKA
jgi:RNA polymerase sigma factor FliA